MARSPKIAIVAEVLEDKELKVVHRSAETLLTEVLKHKKSTGGALNFGELIWPAIIGQDTRRLAPTLYLVPLSRLGAVQGYSGNHVMIGYFMDGKILPSRPMVIKISQPKKANKLRDEAERASSVRLHVAYNPDSFAIPLHFESVDGYGVLWSPFSSNKPILQSYKTETASRLSLGIEDLWFHLRENEYGSHVTRRGQQPVKDAQDHSNSIDPCGVIEKVFYLLKPVHLQGGRAAYRLRRLYHEYKAYLRGFNDGWGSQWAEIWGPATQKRITVDGRRRANPLWVLDQIRQLEPKKLLCGGVHGDLHPRNIIFSEAAAPHIIDFGWAAEDTHIVKDFVLLECNLRFMVLRPELTAGEIAKLAAWVTFGAPPPKTANKYVNKRIQMISKIREEAQRLLDKCESLDTQYTIPLFLTSLGLLKHLRDTDNQFAAVQSVLSLAGYLADSRLLAAR